MTSGKRYASSTDVARLAGVSQSAVSRTYKPGASVAPQTRAKVLAAAETLGYRPSAIPRIMLTHRSNLVAIVVGGLYNPFYAAVLERFTARLQAAGWQVLLVHVDSGHTLDAAVPKLASYRVDAIVSALAILSPEAVAELARLRIPVISFNTPVKTEWISSVSCDNLGAARAIADVLTERGARRFAFISGPASSPASIDRLRGYRERLLQTGQGEPRVVEGDFRYEGGRRAAAELMNGPDRPDAIFCANDLLALGAIDAIRQDLGLRIPEDVMIAGFDDIPSASWAPYDLTTFVHDGARMVDEALAILEGAGGPGASEHAARVIVPAMLIHRGTTDRRAC